MNRVLLAVVCLAVVGLFAGVSAAPVQPAKASTERWEYAELQQRTVYFNPGGQKEWGVRWITAEGVTEAANWNDLGAKLKAPDAAKDANPETHKFRLMTYLGSDGWEVVSQEKEEKGGTTKWLFKRKAPSK